MSVIKLQNVSLKFPVYDPMSRSLQRSITKKIPVGGKISQNQNKITSIMALNNISVSFADGDRVALFGHNGAGKTSMLKLLAGFYEPTAGSIQREGRVSALLNLMAGLDLDITGYDNILLCAMLHGMSRKQALAKMDDIADFSELGPYLDIPVRLYSSGMILRLAFSICTSIECDILLLDEWIGAGDQAFVAKAKERLLEMVSRSTILVFATHDPEVAKRLCTKALYLEHGELQMFGEIEEVLERYQMVQADDQA